MGWAAPPWWGLSTCWRCSLRRLSRSHFGTLNLQRNPNARLHIQLHSAVIVGRSHRGREPLTMRFAVVFNQLALGVLACVAAIRPGPAGGCSTTCRCRGRRWLRVALLLPSFTLHLVQHPSHHFLYDRSLQDFGGRRTFVGVPVQQLLSEVANSNGVVRGDLRCRLFGDLVDEALQIWCIEWHFPGTHLVEDAPHAPNIGAPGIVLALANLW
mmetsp:Transcript_119022/g.167301  ORF Transcript_119022/g.167301 Transcript_119022/m.167301 type:complete len:212 (-) Transcript_119022:549-1184(-)